MSSLLPLLSDSQRHGSPVFNARGRAETSVEGCQPFEQSGDLLSLLLDQQSQLTAVEKFAQHHSEGLHPTASRRYSSLMPTRPPRPGEQYAFEVDLDLCSGCKACVVACHSLNGLDEGEAWRDVGLLQGGTQEQPFLQHVTTACHHCLEPACMQACPVDAYEKDPVTGIVRHLDDQCFGCQYCTLACPYDVPKFHKAKGIVRKCDMCHERLAAGEATACAQACPHQAIRVSVVSREQVINDCEANAFLPGAPNPDYTLPTTSFKSRKVFPRNLLPGDYYDVKPEHAHWPLVLMLVLTQLSVGGFLFELLSHAQPAQETAAGRSLHALFSLAFGLLALAASTLHLGRPHLAHRAMLGLRHSWLSREAAAFGAFAPLAAVYAGLALWNPDWYAARPEGRNLLAVFVLASGVAGVLCGVMVYHVVRRAFWHAARGGVKFLGTTALLGAAATLVTTHVAAAAVAGRWPDFDARTRELCWFVVAATAAKLLFEASIFVHLRDTQFSSLRRSAVLMSRPLANVTLARFCTGAAGGLALPLLLLYSRSSADSPRVVGIVIAAFSLLLAGEILERYLFFTAVVRQKMPGGLSR